jgi:hypothetical protein
MCYIFFYCVFFQKNFDILWTFVWDLLMLECQPSLRHTCEWIIMRMVLKKIDVIDELWSIFDQVNLIRRNVFQVKMSGLIYKVQSPVFKLS